MLGIVYQLGFNSGRKSVTVEESTAFNVETPAASAPSEVSSVPRPAQVPSVTPPRKPSVSPAARASSSGSSVPAGSHESAVNATRKAVIEANRQRLLEVQRQSKSLANSPGSSSVITPVHVEQNSAAHVHAGQNSAASSPANASQGRFVPAGVIENVENNRVIPASLNQPMVPLVKPAQYYQSEVPAVPPPSSRSSAPAVGSSVYERISVPLSPIGGR